MGSAFGLAAAAVLVLAIAALVSLTASGAHHRGNGWFRSAVAGLVFPLTWVVWYERDKTMPRLISLS